LNIYALITTYNRPDILVERAFNSVLNQTQKHHKVVLVDNSTTAVTKKTNKENFASAFPEGVYLENRGSPSASGTWNTGLDWIKTNDPDAWVAIIDDDDEWLENHIEICSKRMDDNDAVLSGIQVLVDGKVTEETIPSGLSPSDFFAGNPGWQGSNTFATVASIMEAGGFDESLLCTNDRDLAVRWLSLTGKRIAYTGVATVKYRLETNRECLTMNSGLGKQTGLLQFFNKHRAIMSELDVSNFIERAKMFDVDEKWFKISGQNNDYPGFPRGPASIPTGITGTFRKWTIDAKKSYWRWRVRPLPTKVLGAQFTRSREFIEIDITYDCNLHCLGCNRSCTQAPTKQQMEVGDVENFVKDSLSKRIEWKKIRVLGGEPTEHPNFEEILYALGGYKLEYPQTRIELVSNGYGKNVARALMRIPPFIHVENTAKTSSEGVGFYAFNDAPIDDEKYKNSDFTNGCSNIEDCGIGLGPGGYYPCTLAGGIDRIMKKNLGRQKLPESDDEMRDLMAEFCKMCGRFQDRKFLPAWYRGQGDPSVQSLAWKKAYSQWRVNNE
jgi:glycosyltransferase involved in cell wall biosynthesis